MTVKASSKRLFNAHTTNGDIRWLSHTLAAVEPTHEVSLLGQYKHSRGDAVDSYDEAFSGHGETRHDVDKSNLEKIKRI